MKKLVFLLLAAFAVASCNDDCDHGFDGGGMDSNLLVGSWYEETQNEENTYSASSAFYGKYCNKLVQGEGQGTYRLDTERNRLTWSYHVNGMGMTSDWKLRDISKYQFVQYSDVAILTYGKIVDTYNMNDGDTKTISFNELNVQGYESTNEHIATVSSDGLVTATGEKGTAYIKVKCLEANVYVKVIVGDNYPDLWIDYSGLLGNDYAAMKNLLGDPDSSSENGGYSLYVYVTELHNILRGLRVSINSDTHKIDQIDMIIREGVPQEELLAYMNAHYYRLGGNYGTQYHYSSSSLVEDSRACYAYDKSKKTIMIITGEDYMDQMGLSFFPNLNSVFGMSKEELKSKMAYRGYSFIQSFDSYSFNGSDSYIITNSNIVTAAEFVFNPDNVVSQYWLYLLAEVDQAEVLKYLREHYTEATDEYVASYGFIFYNETKTLKVVFKPYNNAVIFTDLTQKDVSRVILGNYWKGLGMTKNELKGLFGEPYLERNNDQNNLQFFYAVVSDYIASVTFNFSNNNEVVNLINVFLRDEVKSDEIMDYLNKLYTFYETSSDANGVLHRWINAETLDNADIRISYYPEYGVIVYAPAKQNESTIDSGGNASSFSIPDYSDMFGKNKNQVQEMIKSKGGTAASVGYQVWYRDPKEENIKQIKFEFEEDICNIIIYELDETKITEESVVKYLTSNYSLTSEWKGQRYTFTDNTNHLVIYYEVPLNRITMNKQ